MRRSHTRSPLPLILAGAVPAGNARSRTASRPAGNRDERRRGRSSRSRSRTRQPPRCAGRAELPRGGRRAAHVGVDIPRRACACCATSTGGEACLVVPRSTTRQDSRRLIQMVLKAQDVDIKALHPEDGGGAHLGREERAIGPALRGPRGQDRCRASSRPPTSGKLRQASCAPRTLDFDDLIMRTVELLRDNPRSPSTITGDSATFWSTEYQDTNHAKFVRALMGDGSMG